MPGIVVDDQDAGALGFHGQVVLRCAMGKTARTRVPAPGRALDLELAAELGHDRPADRQAQPVAVRLGREERLLDLGQVLPAGCRSRCPRRPARACRRRRRSPGSATWSSCPVASRALLTRLSRSCSTSAWTANSGGRSAGTSTTSRTPRRSRPSRKIASTPSAAWRSETSLGLRAVPAGEVDHRAEDPPADLDRVLDLAQVGRGHRRVEQSPVDLVPQLLDQREHRAQARCSRRARRPVPGRPSRACARRSAPAARAIRPAAHSGGPRRPGGGTGRSARPRSGRTRRGGSTRS